MRDKIQWMIRRLILLALAFSPLVISQISFAQERAGELSVDEIYLEPNYYTRETQGGEFSLGQSSFTLSWLYKEQFRAKFSVGSLEERYTPQYYSAATLIHDIGVIEAYAEYEGVYGRVRMGLLPLNFGFGGYQSNRDLVFQRSMIYENQVVARRDFGISWYTRYGSYYTELIAHNGELDETNSDGDVWTTANWGWLNDRNLKVQLSMQAGRSSSESTTFGSNGLAGFDKNNPALWRFVDLSIFWFPKKSEIVLQSTTGDCQQDDEKGKMSAHTLDIIHMFAPKWGFGLRYNVYDPDLAVKDDSVSSASVALIAGTAEDTSRVFFIYNRRTEEGNDVPSDDFRLVWRLIPWF